MKKQIFAMLLPCLFLPSAANATPLRPEIDATLCYVRSPRFLDLSYSLCGATRPVTTQNIPSESPTSSFIPVSSVPQFSNSPSPPSPDNLDNPFLNPGVLKPGVHLNTGKLNTGTWSDGNAKNSSGNCKYSWDTDSAGRTCGNRAASRKRGGR